MREDYDYPHLLSYEKEDDKSDKFVMKGAKVVHGGKSKENQKQAESAAELNDSIKQKVDKFIAAKFKKDSQMQDVFKKIEQLVTTTDQPKKKSTEDTSKEEHFEMEKLPEDF